MRKTTFALPDIIFLKFFKQANEKNGTAIANETSTISTSWTSTDQFPVLRIQSEKIMTALQQIRRLMK